MSTGRLDETRENAHFTGGFVACHAMGLWVRELRLNGMTVLKTRYLSDSDPRLQLQTLFGEGVTNSQTPSASKSASNFLTREQLDKSLEVLRHDLL